MGPLIERWNGRRWAVERVPLRGLPSGLGVDGTISSVSCTSPRRCMAIGSVSDYSSTEPQPFVEHWNGSRWSILADTPYATDISCGSAVRCVAVGGATAVVWNGERSKGLAIGAGAFQGVSCTSARTCMAVGSASAPAAPPASPYASSNPTIITARWHRGHWSVQLAPRAIGAVPSALAGVSCASRSACVAVGSASYTQQSSNVPLAESWHRRAWSIIPTPLPATAASGALQAVSCLSPTRCVAVGYFTNTPGGAGQPLVEVYDGAAWAIQNAPNPSGSSSNQLAGVSCVTTTDCTAVGSSFGAFDVLPLIERWNGSVWAIQTEPTVSGGQLNGVSCTSPTACIAVGSLPTPSGLAFVWNGTSWSAQNLADDGELKAVSCSSGSACTAVGFGLGAQPTLVQRWSGSSWSTQVAPKVSNLDNFNGVSCSSATACTAVGNRSTGRDGYGPLAEAWDGQSWSTQRAPKAPNTILQAVSCRSGPLCMAVGNVNTAEPDEPSLPFAERRS